MFDGGLAFVIRVRIKIVFVLDQTIHHVTLVFAEFDNFSAMMFHYSLASCHYHRITLDSFGLLGRQIAHRLSTLDAQSETEK